ncbi:MAG: hypothetical protein A2X94_05570 [Bdellovibrionales bacterium GWB1_55_8]|nr:MAG: hypothetical protein A2X94_05570 [Bdellovibrionales bacterium GWB1_55_8]
MPAPRISKALRLRNLAPLLLPIAASLASADATPKKDPPNPVAILHFWGIQAKEGKTFATCTEILVGPPSSERQVPVSGCMADLGVKYEPLKEGPDTCAAYTRGGQFIKTAKPEDCAKAKASNQTCPDCAVAAATTATLSAAIITSLEELSGKILLADGGGTSGGGDKDGLEAATHSLTALQKAISQAGPQIYTPEEKKKLLNAAEKLKILMVSQPLSVKTSSGVIQESTGYSFKHDGVPISLLNRDGWKQIENAIEREKFLHHELCVLEGIETTGDYHKTSKYDQFRKHSWKFRENETNICSISVYKLKKTLSGKPIPGEPLGSTSAVLTFTGASGGGAKLFNLNKKRDVKALWVIGSEGYLRLKIVDSERNDKSSFLWLYGEQKTLFNETILVDPFGDEFYTGTTVKNVVFDDYFMTVSCTSQ